MVVGTGPARTLTEHWLVAGSVMAVTMLPVAIVSTVAANRGPGDAPYVAWALVFCAPLVLVVRFAEVTLMLLLLPIAVQWLVIDGPLVCDASVLIGVAFLASQRSWRTLLYWMSGVALVALGMSLDWTLGRRHTDPPVVTAINIASVFLVVVGLLSAAALLGVVYRMQRDQATRWRERAALLERDRYMTDELALAGERSRIAADMHDILAHSLALIAVQTDAAQLLLRDRPQDPGRIRDAHRAVEAAHQASVQALRDTRQLVSALSDPDGDRSPQPRLQDLPTLVRKFDSGQGRFTVKTREDLAGLTLPLTAQVAVYRIVQEALTNVLKHAGPEAHATVSVGVAEGLLRVDVQDDGLGVVAPGRRGHGLTNMRQRALSVGGTLEAGPDPAGGFVVRVDMPVKGRPLA